MAILKKTYEKNRPVVLSVSPFESGQLVDPSSHKLGFALDGKFVTFELDTLKLNQRYQILVGKGFRDLNGINIKTYLIDFRTRE